MKFDDMHRIQLVV